ncbi:MAG: HAD family hydrolase [Muribaculaceae bacterium]
MYQYSNSTKIIVFDLDDTLYKEKDFVKSGYRAVSQYLEQHHNITGAYDAMLQAFEAHANPFDALAPLAKGSTLPPTDTLLEIYRYHKPDITLSRETQLTLDYLAGEDAILCLITDGRSITQRNKIEALGLTQYFDEENISISEEIGAEKTQPLPFKEMMKKHSAASHFYYVGDNTAKDFFWPNRLNWTTICVEDNGVNIHKQNFEGDRTHNPDIIISSLYELTSVIFD